MSASTYNAEQVARLREIGQYLRQVREEKHLSLEEIAARTRIQPRLLRAIEESQVRALPEPIYVQGFLRQYARRPATGRFGFAESEPGTTGDPNPPRRDPRPVALCAPFICTSTTWR